MNGPSNQSDVGVSLRGFSELFATAIYDVALDSYQRPYVWTPEKIEQLIEDLREHQAYVIGGQQRLAALCI